MTTTDQASLLRVMALLAEMTGWGSSFRVTMAYTEIIQFIAQDETERTGRFTWSVSTTICGLDDKTGVSATGADLITALTNLADAVIKRHEGGQEWHMDKRTRALKALQRYIADTATKQNNHHSEGPYR